MFNWFYNRVIVLVILRAMFFVKDNDSVTESIRIAVLCFYNETEL